MLRIRVTPERSAIQVPLMALTCAHALTDTKESTVPKTSTNAKLVRPANTTDFASILQDRSVVVALGVLPAPDAKLTSMNATRILAKMTELVSMNVEPSAVSACQVCTCVDLFRVWQ